MFIASLWCISVWLVESTVLDPSLYLSPSPPLTDTSTSVPPVDLWSRSVEDREARDRGDLPRLIEESKLPLTSDDLRETAGSDWMRRAEESRRSGSVSFTRKGRCSRPTTNRKPHPMEKAKLFWPPLHSSRPSVGAGNIQVPLTFSLSGLYGKYSPATMGSGVIGSSYGTVSEIGGAVVSGLAGSSYGKYRTYSGLRIYGGENGPAWSGWGNGKWGNYGKG